MIKTVKVKKQLRLDELIKYVRDNGVNGQAFVDDAGRASVYFGSEQRISFGEYVYGDFGIDRTFTVEVEEEITEYTEFVGVQEIFFNKESKELEVEIHDPLKRKTINDVIEEHYECTECRQIYALINKKLQLIWEAE